MIYKIIVQDENGNNIGEFEKFRNLRFNKVLNNYSSANFAVPVGDPKISSLIALRLYTIKIYRGDTLVWAGEQATREGNLDNKGDNWVSITCYSWFEQLNSRYTPNGVTYTGVDAGQIAWELIDDTQSQTNGDYGITQGTIEATQNRDRTYYNKNIAEAIIELSNVINGFDFEINDSKGFNVFALQGVDRSDTVVLEYGINVTTVRITEDFSKPTNRAIVIGDSGVLAEPMRVNRNNAPLQPDYKIRENLINEMIITESETLEDKGDALLRKFQYALVKLSLGISRKTPTIEDFALGDIIRIKIKSGIYDIDRNFRIFEWGIAVNPDNTETLDLTLGDFTL
jgi:hypothetical protein